MKKFWLILLLVISGASLFARGDSACLTPLKEKAKSLKKCVSSKQADEVKQIMKDIITGIQKCGFSDNEIQPLVKLQNNIERELDKKEKEKKKNVLPGQFYSMQMLNGLNDLEAISAPPPQKLKDKGTPPSDNSGKEQELLKTKKQDTQSPSPPAEKKIETSFPAGEFTIPGEQKKVKKAPVTAIEALKTRLGLMEQRISHLNGSVGFYRYAFIFIVIITFILAGLIVLFILILRSHGDKLNNLDQRASQMHRKISDYMNSIKMSPDEYRVNKKPDSRNLGGKDK